MRLMTILLSLLFTFSAFSKTELHCELYDSGKASTRTKTINQRIKQLEQKGYHVIITQLTSAIGGANKTIASASGQARKVLEGRIRHEKCAALVYTVNAPQ